MKPPWKLGEWCGSPCCLCVVSTGECASLAIVRQVVLDAAKVISR